MKVSKLKQIWVVTDSRGKINRKNNENSLVLEMCIASSKPPVMNQVGIQAQYMGIKNENRGNSEFFVRDLSEKLLYQWKTTTVAVCKCHDSIGG